METFSGRQSQRAAVHEPTAVTAQTPPQPYTSPRPAEPVARDESPKKRGKRLPQGRGWWIWLIIVVVAAMALQLVLSYLLQGGGMPGVDRSKYQAVFLTDKSIYVGKLQEAGKSHYKLTNVFYPQNSPSGDTKDTAANVQLVKLGADVLGAEDEIIIARDHVMFYENIKADSQATKAIKSYLEKR